MRREYQILSSFDAFSKVRRLGEGHILIQGDSGGETYLACPTGLVDCSAESLFLLMLDLEALIQTGCLSGISLGANVPTAGYDAWVVCGHFDMGKIYQGSEISDQVWICDEVADLGLENEVRAVIAGEKERL